MILIGTMNWSSTRGSGNFPCPACHAVTPYQYKVSRPFLTLYFVPLVPLGGLEEYVQCRACRQAFEPAVLGEQGAGLTLGTPTKPQVPKEVPFETEMLRLIALTMAEDGRVTENEVRIARRLYENMTQTNITVDELMKVYRQARSMQITPNDYLAAVAHKFDYDQRIQVVQAMFAVAGADGEIGPNHMQTLIESREILELEESAFQSAVLAAPQWVS
jgi:uncharacterized tellurite resistance protein B-like protein